MRLRVNLLYSVVIVFALILMSQSLSHAGFAIAQGTPRPLAASPNANSIFVPGNYSTIQEAVDAAMPGDTIYVDAGTYDENVVVTTENLTIMGHGYEDTILSGNNSETGFTIQGMNITLSGFTVKEYINGIIVANAWNCSIVDNYVTSTKMGIWLNYAADCLVSGNYVIDCEHNLRLAFSTNNTLIDNTMRGNASYNFALYGSSIENYFQSIDTSNTVNDKPIQYITNAQDLTINPQTYPDLGCLIVVNSSKIAVSGISVSNSYDAILFAYVSDSTIENVNVVNNKIGVDLFNSPNCAVLDSYIQGNMYQGILSQVSPHATISGNTLISNTDGIYMGSNSSSIQQNIIENNEVGLNLYRSFNSVFLHNSIIDNQQQVNTLESGMNQFDNGKEGNYWSNYTGDDMNNDGIGDTKLPHEGLDNHPMMGEYQAYQITNGGTIYTVETISSDGISNLRLNQTKGTISFDVATSKTVGFTRITLPNAMVNNASMVTVNGSKPLRSNVMAGQTQTTVYIQYYKGLGHVEIGAAAINFTLVAEAGPNQTAIPYKIVNFNGNSSRSDFGIETYLWDFGDGTIGTGENVRHSYTASGNYTVTLQVTDTEGNIATDTATVTVNQPAGNTDTDVDSSILPEPPTWWLALTVFIDFIAVDVVVMMILMRQKRNKLKLAN